MGERRAENPLSHYLLPLTIPGTVRHNRCVEHSYVMLRYTESTVLFDERFINYGCNKVQYVDHLRLLGYSFFIPSEVFSTDLVHREYGRAFTFTHSSSFRNRFVKSFGVKEVPEHEIQLPISSEDSAVISDVADDNSGDSRGESSDDRVSGDPSPASTVEEEVETPEEVPSESSKEVSNQSSKEVSTGTSQTTSNQPPKDTSKDTPKEITKNAPKKRRSVSKDWHRRAGRSSKATPAFLSHPNGPFSVYFEPQIDRRTQFSLS